MHETFRHALNPKPRHGCLLLPLKPLTLGHLFLLQELRSPILTGEPHHFGHVLTAVIVCAQPHQEARRMLEAWWIRLFAWYWGVRCRKLNLEEEAGKFFAYLKDERELPPLTPPPPGQGKCVCAPWEWVLFDLLCSTYRKTRNEALATSVAEANALWAVHGDADGRLNLATASGSVESILKGIWRRRREAAQN